MFQVLYQLSDYLQTTTHLQADSMEKPRFISEKDSPSIPGFTWDALDPGCADCSEFLLLHNLFLPVSAT